MNKKEIEKLITVWKKRPYSWSQHSSFDWDEDEWFVKYVLGVKGDSSVAMEFGNEIGDRLGVDPSFLPEVPRQPHIKPDEYSLEPVLDGFKLIGFFDAYKCTRTGCKKCKGNKKPTLEEYKTSSNANKWNQKSVNAHGQITYYCMLLYLVEKIKPEDVAIRLHYIPVEENASFEMEVSGKPQSFPTKRTMRDVLRLMVEIKKRRKEMEAHARKRLEEYDPEEITI